MTTIAGKRGEKVNKILQGACSYYGITMEELCAPISSQASRKHAAWKWRRFLILVLYEHTDLDIAEISRVLGYKTYNNTNHHLTTLKEELSSELYGSDKIKLNYKQLLNHLQL